MSTNPRYFVGLRLAEDVKNALHALTSVDMSGVRWVRKSNYHITLRYLGPENKIDVAKIEQRLKKIKMPKPFEVNFKGAGRFEKNVMWAGVENSKELSKMNTLVDKAVDDIPNVRESLPEFNPHMTLARLKGHLDLAALDKFIADHSGFTLPPILMKEIVLFKNETIPEGGVITQEYKYYKLG